METKRGLIFYLGKILIILIIEIFFSYNIIQSKEMTIKLGESFTAWEYEPLKYEGGQKQTQYRIVFDQILFEGEKLFDRYDTPPPGKKFIKITFTFENLGPRPGARAPDIEGELKTSKGHFFPEKSFYWAKIQKYADPGGKGNGHLIFLIPIEENPTELVGKIFGSFPYSEKKATPFRLSLSKGETTQTNKLKGNYFPTIKAEREIKLIEHYLTPGRNPQIYLAYENISKRDLKILIGIFWFDSTMKQLGQLDERGPIPPGGKEIIVYPLKNDQHPEKITNYSLYIGTKSSMVEGDLLPAFWIPNIYPIVRPIRVIETPIFSTEFVSLEVANFSSKELSMIGKTITELIKIELEQGRLRRTLCFRTQAFSIELESVADLFPGLKKDFIGSISARSLAWVDQKIKNLENFLNKELPDVDFAIRPPRKMISYNIEDKIIIDSLIKFSKLLLDIDPTLTGMIIETIGKEAWYRITSWIIEKIILKDLGYAEIKKPKIGNMSVCYDRKKNVASIFINFEDFPERLGWKNERLIMFISFESKLSSVKNYKVIQRALPTYLSDKKLSIESSIKISPMKKIYRKGDILDAEFDICNKSDSLVLIDTLTLAGQLNGTCPNNKCPDFDWRTDIKLFPGDIYRYKGKLKLDLPGNYHFSVTYRTKEGWESNFLTAQGINNSISIKVE